MGPRVAKQQLAKGVDGGLASMTTLLLFYKAREADIRDNHQKASTELDTVGIMKPHNNSLERTEDRRSAQCRYAAETQRDHDAQGLR